MTTKEELVKDFGELTVPYDDEFPEECKQHWRRSTQREFACDCYRDGFEAALKWIKDPLIRVIETWGEEAKKAEDRCSCEYLPGDTFDCEIHAPARAVKP